MTDGTPQPKTLTAKQQAFVAAYIGSANGNASLAARMAGYAKPYASAADVLENPTVLAAIDSWKAEIKASGIAEVERRIQNLSILERKLQTVIDARAASAESHVPGDETGLIVRRLKVIGAGPSAEMVTEYEVDHGTIREIRAIYDDVAKEMGHRREGLDISGNLTSAVALVGVDPEDV